jgi:hypothetical protein
MKGNMSQPTSTIRMLLLLTALLQLGCGASRPFPAVGPAGVRTVAVEPIDDRTGDPLVIEDPGLLGRVFDVERSTVPGLLRSDLRATLTARGFEVVAEPGRDAAVLHTELRRWTPYTADYSMVVVDLTAWLVEPSGRELWRLERRDWRVPTRDARSSYEAAIMAADGVAEGLVGDWQSHD